MKPASVNLKALNSRALHFLIADGHPIVRSGLHKVLHRRFKNANFEFAATGDEALGAARTRSFDAILLEVETPSRTGLETLSRLRLQSPATPVLVVTMRSDEKLTLPALAAGAAGFIGKSAPMPTLLKAVEKVVEGGIYLSENLTRQLFLRLHKSSRARLQEILSPLELEVFAQIVLGRSARQIADTLTVAVRSGIADGVSAREDAR